MCNLKRNRSSKIQIGHFGPPNIQTLDINNKADSPINLDTLKQWLTAYPKQADKELLWDGFSNGFRIPYTGPRASRFACNHKSAIILSSVVQDKLEQEIARGRVAGPFQHTPIPNPIVSPLGLVPKENDEYKLIFDLSFPINNSINSGIAK